MNLQRGMIFATKNPMALGKAINAISAFWSSDNDSEYSHSGIILNPEGDTFESLWRIRHNHLSAYIGKKVIIGRLVGPTAHQIDSAIMTVISDHNGQMYPFWRLPLHIVPPLAKYLSTGRYPVCSELTYKLIRLSGIGHTGRWQGKTPDHVADFIKHDDACECVFEGVLEAEAVPIVS